MQDAEGFHDPRDGTVVIFRDNVRVLEGETAAQALARVVVHERVGHHGFDTLRESDSKFAEEWKRLASAIPADQMKELQGRYKHLNGNREALALEWFAHQVGNMEGRAQLQPGSVVQQMWQALRDWVMRKIQPLGDPSKEMTQGVIDAHVRGLIRATQRSMVKGAKQETTRSSTTSWNQMPARPAQASPIEKRPSFSLEGTNVDDENFYSKFLTNETTADLPGTLADHAKAFAAAARELDRGGSTGAGEEASGGIQTGDLAKWAESKGALVPDESIDGLPIISNSTSEHEVHLRAADGRVVKRTWAGFYGQVPVWKNGKLERKNATPAEYMQRMILQILVFKSDLKLEGVNVSNKPSMILGQPAGQPSVVISQPLYEHKKTAPLGEIKTFLEREGFIEVKGSYFGWTRRDGVSIVDAKPDNFMVTEDGTIALDLQMSWDPARVTE
jgi:hypothetical protein